MTSRESVAIEQIPTAQPPLFDPTALIGHGATLHQAGQIDAAEQAYRAALALAPQHPDGLHLMAVVLSQRGRPSEAEPLARQALAQQPHSSPYHNTLGRILLQLGRVEEALVELREALRLAPQNPEAHFNVGEALLAQGQAQAAQQAFRRALELKPTHALAAFGLGRALWAAGDQPGAVMPLQIAAWLAPNEPLVVNHLGVAYLALGHHADAEAMFQRVLELQPDNPAVLSNLGVLAYFAGRRAQAKAYYERALALAPELQTALDGVIEVRRVLCDWPGLPELQQRTMDMVRQRWAAGAGAGIRAFTALYLPFSAAEMLRVARDDSAGLSAGISGHVWDEQRALAPGRLRVGFLSADIRQHPVGLLLSHVFGLVDRQRYEVFVYSTGPDDGGAVRRQVLLGVEHFREARHMTSAELARMIADDGVQVLVDLAGHTADTRMAMLARRPAPVQVHYLGFPGSTGAAFIDYLVVDPFIVPPQRAAQLISETPIYLPVYQINSHARWPQPPALTRADLGLPEDGFVFCCLNNTYKITPELFDLWMRLLQRVPGSCLVLLGSSPEVADNLRREAQARGVDGQRLMFFGYVAPEVNLARLRLMDLFLDTPAYNAGATATDALWAGLPVLTLPGEHYIARVAASMLLSLGLSEGVARDLADYEARAAHWASDGREALAAYRQRLHAAVHAPSQPALFDTPSQVRRLFAALETAWQRFCNGADTRAPIWAEDTEPGGADENVNM